MHIPLVYEHLFYKYFVLRSVGQATKGKTSFATYGCCHPCLFYGQNTLVVGKIGWSNVLPQKICLAIKHLLGKGILNLKKKKSVLPLIFLKSKYDILLDDTNKNIRDTINISFHINLPTSVLSIWIKSDKTRSQFLRIFTLAFD